MLEINCHYLLDLVYHLHHFETAKEMVDYLEPVSKKLGVNISDGMSSFERFLEDKFMEAGEEFHIVRDGYLYVCRE